MLGLDTDDKGHRFGHSSLVAYRHVFVEWAWTRFRAMDEESATVSGSDAKPGLKHRDASECLR